MVTVKGTLISRRCILSSTTLRRARLAGNGVALTNVRRRRRLLTCFRLTRVTPSGRTNNNSTTGAVCTFTDLNNGPFCTYHINSSSRNTFCLESLRRTNITASSGSVRTNNMAKSYIITIARSNRHAVRACLNASDSVITSGISFSTLARTS